MSSPNTSEKSVYLDREEHFHRGEIGAKTVVPYYYDADTDTLVPATSDVPAGASTEVNQITTQNLIYELSSLINSLKFLSQAQGIAADLRVTLLSGVLTTVTTVTTLTGQTNIGGFGAQHTIMNQMNTNVATAIRNNISIT